jgi:hypothetical protein
MMIPSTYGPYYLGGLATLYVGHIILQRHGRSGPASVLFPPPLQHSLPSPPITPCFSLFAICHAKH